MGGHSILIEHATRHFIQLHLNALWQKRRCKFVFNIIHMTEIMTFPKPLRWYTHTSTYHGVTKQRFMPHRVFGENIPCLQQARDCVAKMTQIRVIHIIQYNIIQGPSTFTIPLQMWNWQMVFSLQISRVTYLHASVNTFPILPFWYKLCPRAVYRRFFSTT